MSSWASRRKTAYALIVILAVLLLIGLPLFIIFYKAPTCFDKVMNGNETGVDCGGSCVRLCQNSFIPPRIVWGGAKFEKLANGLYNIASLIENKNINGAAVDVPYKMSLYDSSGISIVDRVGKVNIYPHRNSLAFESAVDVGKRIPAKVSFEFTKEPNWFKSQDSLDGISIVDKKYVEDDSGSSLEVVLENTTLFPYKNIMVSVVLYDKENNVIGFSRTSIDSIASKNQREIASFTWPINRKGAVTSIEIVPTAVPTVER